MSRELHPVLSVDERRRLFHQGIDLFNRGEHYAAHEVWEDIWRSNMPEPRELFQGLIQVAAALHQFHDLHRTNGPIRTFSKARSRLEPYAPAAWGLDIAGLLEAVRAWQLWLDAPDGDPPAVPILQVLDWGAVA